MAQEAGDIGFTQFPFSLQFDLTYRFISDKWQNLPPANKKK